MYGQSHLAEFSRAIPWWEGGQRVGGRPGWQLQEEADLSLCVLCTYAYICIWAWNIYCPNGWRQLPSCTACCRILSAPRGRDQDSCCCCCPPSMLLFLTAANQTRLFWMLTVSSSVRHQNQGLSKLTRVLLLYLRSYHISFSLISYLERNAIAFLSLLFLSRCWTKKTFSSRNSSKAYTQTSRWKLNAQLQQSTDSALTHHLPSAEHSEQDHRYKVHLHHSL